ncbi:MAG: hypothetical protein HZC55_06655 [Verrucomicrobia bacterium]|nr:hypothetical protein [Verrucomicrobiota bacterium]
MLYLPRPFLLGFYHDDWWSLVEAAAGTTAFSAERLANLFSWDAGYASRPLAGLTCFLISSVAGTHAPLWQLANALQVAVAAWALCRLLQVISAQLAATPEAPRLPAHLAVGGFLLTPWNLGMTAWPVASGSLLSLAGFALGAANLLEPGARPGRAWRSSAWCLASFLCYEGFYLQWGVILALAAGWGMERRELVRSAAALAAVQIVAVLYNRAIAGFLPNEATKQYFSEWPRLWWESLFGLPGELAHTLPGSPDLGQGLFLLGGVVILLAAWRVPNRPLARKVVTLVLAALALAATAALVHALAGYRLTSAGVMSRTTYSLSLALALPVLAAAHFAGVPPWLAARRPLGVVAAGVAALLAAGQFLAVSCWASVWRLQREVLAAMPVERIRRLSPAEDRVLFVGPAYQDHLVVFGAEWDLTAAVRHRPELAPGRRAFTDVVRIHPATAQYVWHWNGSVLTQDCPGYWVRRFPVKRLHLWNHYTGTFSVAAPGFRFTPADHPEYRR